MEFECEGFSEELMGRGTALITGASSGIGEAFARLFAQKGFNLILTARNEKKLNELSKSLNGIETAVVSADLSETEGIEKLISEVEKKSESVDVIVNNAGMMTEGPFHEMREKDIEKILTLNMFATVKITHRFIKAMRERGNGRILNVASVAAFHPFPSMDIYAATKAFVLSFTESLAENYRSDGIFVTALCPGITNTQMAEQDLIKIAPDFLILEPEEVAREGYEALMNREVINIPGPANRLAIGIAKHQPRSLIRNLGRISSKILAMGAQKEIE